MENVLKFGKMELFLKDFMLMEKNKDQANIFFKIIIL